MHRGPVVFESDSDQVSSDFAKIIKCLEMSCCWDDEEEERKREAILRDSMPHDLEEVDANFKIDIGEPDTDEMMKLMDIVAVTRRAFGEFTNAGITTHDFSFFLFMMYMLL